jgi:methionyl-tRNA formyltransferase
MPLGASAERVKILRSAIASTDDTCKAEPGTVMAADADGGLVIACGAGAVRLVQVQRAGRKPMGVAEFLRGAQLSTGTALA